jgi:hypothetical protein
MADINNLQKAKVLNRLAEVYAFLQTYAFSFVSATAANGDRVRLIQVTRAMRVFQSFLSVSATLGASCTIQLQRDRAGVYTNMTVATTAGAASIVSSITLGAIDLAVDDYVVVLVGGANITAAATVTVDMLTQSA